MASRSEALQNVETTIVELGSIFRDLATMVAQQGEMAIRYAVVDCNSFQYLSTVLSLVPVHCSSHVSAVPHARWLKWHEC